MTALAHLFQTRLPALGSAELESLNDALDELLNCNVAYENFGQKPGDWELRFFAPDDVDAAWSMRRKLPLSMTVGDVIRLACRLKRDGETQWSAAA